MYIVTITTKTLYTYAHNIHLLVIQLCCRTFLPDPVFLAYVAQVQCGRHQLPTQRRHSLQQRLRREQAEPPYALLQQQKQKQQQQQAMPPMSQAVP